MNTSRNFQKILSNCQWDLLSRVNNLISTPSGTYQNIVSAAINDELILLYFPSNSQKDTGGSIQNMIHLKNLKPDSNYFTYAYNSAFDYFQELGTFTASSHGELTISSLPFFRDFLLILKKSKS